jgi:hypothetical protein
MQSPRLIVLTGAVVLAYAASTGTAVAAGPCDAIAQESTRVSQEQLAFTNQAYSDGQITPEEAAQSNAYALRIHQITLDLGDCLRTGIVPPGYPPVTSPPVPDTVPPVFNTFDIPLLKWRIGDSEFRISWNTGDEPTRVSVGFYRISKGVVSSSASAPRLNKGGCRKPRKSDKKPKSCQLLTRVGALNAPLGATSITFKGKVGGRALKPASYLLKATATDAAGNKSQVKTTKLKILAAKH